MNFAIIGGDARFSRLAELLRADGHSVRCAGLEGAGAACLPLEDALRDAKIVILPLPACAGEAVNAPLAAEKIDVRRLAELIRPGQTVLAGKPEGALAELVPCVDYFAREELTVRNAAATAEGALEILLRELPVTLLGERVLVVGFGRIGKLLALRLHLLGARVAVSARKPADLAWIECLGLEAARTERLDVSGFRAVVNTVPALVLDERRLTGADRDCLLLDLASKPGGIDFDAAKRLGLRTVHALGLPGRACPETAAAAIRDTIYNVINDLECG